MNKTLIILAGAAALLVAAPAVAHHSFAMFDNQKDITIEGTIKEFQWTNPHSWIQVLVPDGAGGMKEWSVEGGSPNGLARQGWHSTSLKPGDKVQVAIHPMKNGSAGGSLIGVTLPTGEKLGDWVRPSKAHPGGGAGLGTQ